MVRRIFLREEVVQGRSRSGVIARQCERQKKAIKKENHGIAVTPTCGGFRRDELDTVADWGWRIFLWEGVVQGRSRSIRGRGMARTPILENSKKAKKRRITESALTPTLSAFRRC